MVFTCITERQYEPAGFEIRASDVVVDVGAHIGSFALFVASRGARVIACEPSPDNFQMLSENIARNQARNVTPVQACIAEENGTRKLFLDARNTARNGLYGAGNAVSVSSITLAELFAQHNITQCDFLKMDCEGAEYEIIEMTPLKTLLQIEKIAMEYHLPPYFGLSKNTHRLSTITQKLEGAGFMLTVIPENKLRGLLFAKRRPKTD